MFLVMDAVVVIFLHLKIIPSITVLMGENLFMKVAWRHTDFLMEINQVWL